MIVAKQLADFITFTRALLVLVFTWLGIAVGTDGLPLVAILMLYSWTSDAIDGSLARRSSRVYHTWIGDHDLQVDMTVALGLLIYMLLAGYVPLIAGGLYITAWIILFILFFKYYRSMGMTFQAPIYGYFIWVAIQNAPPYGLTMIAWILAALAITWPRFPKEVIPGFLGGFHTKPQRKR